MRMRFRLLGLTLALLAGVALAEPPPMADDSDMQSKPLPEKKVVKRGSRLFLKPAKATPREQLFYAYSLYTNDHIRAAARAYQALVFAWPDSNAEAAQAQLSYAKLMEIRRKYAQAFDEYQYLIEQYPGHFSFNEVIDRQFAIAEYLMNAKVGQHWFFPGFASPERALKLFETVVENAPSSERAPAAQYNVGYIRAQGKEWEEAVAAYALVQARYPLSPFAAKAAYQEAFCLYEIARRRPVDEDSAMTAYQALARFVRDYPTDENVGAAREHMKALDQQASDLAYGRASYYDHIAKKPKAALVAYKDYLRRFPASDRVPAIMTRIGELESTTGSKP